MGERVRVPDPAASRRLSWVVLLALGTVALGVVWWMHVAEAPQTVVLEATAGALALLSVVACVLLVPATVELSRAGGEVLGLKGGALPAGEGRVVVTRVSDLLDGDDLDFVFEVHHVTGARSRRLVRRGHEPTRVRAFAEGLSRLGGYEMVWRSPGGDEVRAPADLDTPLRDRLAVGQDGDDGTVDGEPVKTRALPLGGVEIESTRLLWPGLALILTVPALVLGFGEGLARYRTPSAELWRLGLAVGAGLLLGAPALVLDRALSQPVAVTPEAVTLRRRILGVPLRTRVLDTARLESLYVEAGRLGGYHLVFASDQVHQRAGRYGTLGEALAARRAVVGALLGGEVPPAPALTPGR